MTYDAREKSTESAQPIELYEIRFGTEAWYLTTAEGDQTVGPNTYQTIAITRTSIQLGREGRAEAIEVVIPSDHAFPKKFIASVPGQRASLIIKRYHRGDTEVVTIFKGHVQNVSFTSDGSAATMRVMPLTSAQDRAIPRFSFQGLCNHALYDSRCKVTQSLFKYTNTVSVVNGKVLTINGLGGSQPSGWANGGMVAIGTSERRLIVEHVGDDIRLYTPFPTSPLNLTVDVFAGCDHTMSTCDAKFNNVPNYGGFPFVPLKDIFRKGLD